MANAFSLLRCFIFGFFPSVLILYLIYYNIFAIVAGLLGKMRKGKVGVRERVIIVFAAVVMTVFFTALDDIITPLYYGFDSETAKAYALASLAAMVPQIICAIITVAVLFPALVKAFGHNILTNNMR